MENDDSERPFDVADAGIDSRIVLSAEAKRVLEEMEKLEPIYKDVLYLRFTEDLTPKEIGKIIGETANVISVRIARGLEKLKEKFNK